MGFEVVGFLDDDPGKAGSTVCGVPVLGTLRQADEVLAAQRIDQVFIALPLEAHKKMLQILELMARECVEVKLVPDILQYATLKAALEDVDGTPVINLSQMPLQGWNSMVKRGDGPRHRSRLAGRAAAALPAHRARHLARRPRPDLLPPGAHGARRQARS